MKSDFLRISKYETVYIHITPLGYYALSIIKPNGFNIKKNTLLSDKKL